MDDIYKNIEEYHPNKKRKIIIVFDDLVAYMLSRKTLIQKLINMNFLQAKEFCPLIKVE